MDRVLREMAEDEKQALAETLRQFTEHRISPATIRALVVAVFEQRDAGGWGAEGVIAGRIDGDRQFGGSRFGVGHDELSLP